MHMRRTPELLRRGAASFAAASFAVLVPKCPVCVAAWLAGLGLGAGVSRGAAPFVRPLAFAVAGVAVMALMLGLRRRTRRRACGCRRV